ncbi:hypothetical protein BGZ49_006386, partial [Haplosporangium sp. Z 27]
GTVEVGFRVAYLVNIKGMTPVTLDGYLKIRKAKALKIGLVDARQMVKMIDDSKVEEDEEEDEVSTSEAEVQSHVPSLVEHLSPTVLMLLEEQRTRKREEIRKAREQAVAEAFEE